MTERERIESAAHQTRCTTRQIVHLLGDGKRDAAGKSRLGGVRCGMDFYLLGQNRHLLCRQARPHLRVAEHTVVHVRRAGRVVAPYALPAERRRGKRLRSRCKLAPTARAGTKA